MKQTYFLVSSVSALVGAAVCAIVVIWFMKPELTAQEFRPQIDRSQSEKFVTRITPDPAPLARVSASKGAFENVRTLADTLEFEADFDQTVAIHLLLANADEAFVLDLLGQADTLSPPSQKEAAYSIIFSKYAALDPSRALARAEGLPQRLHQRVLMNIFHEWARNDLERAIETADDLEGYQRQTAGYVILTSRDDLAPARRAEIAERLDQKQQLASINQQSWLDSALENPRSAWQEALSRSKPELNTRWVRVSVANAWIAKEGIVALDEMVASISKPADKRELLYSILPSLMGTDPQYTLDFISQLPSAQEVRNLRQNAFRIWSRREPEAAVQSLLTMDLPEKESVIETVLAQWGRSDPRELLEASDTIPQSWIDTAKRHALIGLARSSREEAISYLDQITEPRSRHEVENTLANMWAEEDPNAALTWFLSLDRDESAEHRNHTRYLMMSFADRDPASALRFAAGYSGDWGTALVSGIFEALARVDPQQALQHLPSVNKDQKRVAVETTGFALARDDLMGAFQLGDFLDPTDRLQYGKSLVDRSLFGEENRNVFLSNFNDLPSRELKAHGAVYLIQQDEFETFLTNAERQKLFAVLNAKERAKLEANLQQTRKFIKSQSN